MATDKIVAEYTVKVDAALKNLDKLANKVDKIDDERKKTQAGFKDMSSSLASSFKKIGGIIATAFAVDKIVDFGKEAVKLASQMEGVERAFSRIGGANSASLLDGLRKATRGTVSDLVLMQKAVQASNFKIPLENLASLFKFAQARARETGESVEYLTNSIVLGIGRKSPLILDNLGISAVELRTRLKGVGVEAANVGDIAEIIGDIAEEELAKMGDQADTTADKMEQLSASTENLTAALGSLLTETAEPTLDFFTKLSTAIANDINEFSRFQQSLKGDSGLALLNKLTAESARLKELETDATEKAGKVRDAEFNKLNQAVEFQRELVNAIRSEIDARVSNSVEQEITVDLINRETEAYRKLLEEQNQSVVTISSLQSELKNLQDELKNAEVGGSGFFVIIDKITAKTKELNEAIALTKLDDALKVDTEESIDAFGQVIGATDSLNATVTDIFGGAGSAMVEAYWDTFLQNSLDALETTEERTKRLMELEELRRQDNRDFFDTTLMAWQSLTNTVATLVEAQYQRQYNALDQSLKKEQITREQYDKRKAQLGREQAKKQKEFAIVQAVINTALGVTNAFATAPNIILGAVLAAVVAAAGAAEIATISSQPLPQFAEGGWVDGKGLIHGRSHKQGGVKIEAEGNEYITKGKYAKPNAEILEAINTGNWERYKMENIITPAIEQVLSGGMENIGASYMLQNQFNDRNILRGLDRNRMSEKNGFIYLGDRIERALLSKGNDRYA